MRSTLTVHHHIHACQLRPDLSEHPDVGAVEILRVEQLPVSNVGELCLKRARCLDILQLVLDEGAVGIAFAVDQGQDLVALFPPVFACEPARRLWHEEHEAEEEDCRQHLNTPSKTQSQLMVQIYRRFDMDLRDSEDRLAVVVGILVGSTDERSAVRDAVSG